MDDKAARAFRKHAHRIADELDSKLSDPRYPYWNWLLGGAVPEETHLKLSLLLSILHGRVTETQIPEEQSQALDGLPHDLLYGAGPLHVEQVFAAIKSITGMTDDWQVVDMLRAVSEQGMFPELCDHLLSSLALATR